MLSLLVNTLGLLEFSAHLFNLPLCMFSCLQLTSWPLLPNSQAKRNFLKYLRKITRLTVKCPAWRNVISRRGKVVLIYLGKIVIEAFPRQYLRKMKWALKRHHRTCGPENWFCVFNILLKNDVCWCTNKKWNRVENRNHKSITHTYFSFCPQNGISKNHENQ